jgi:heat-inducible transcriptional repressor
MGFLQQAAEDLAKLTNTAVFISAPRFEQDFIIGARFVAIDSLRCLCILITDFGEIKTEVISTPHKLSSFLLKRIEDYFQWRITGFDKPENLDLEEEKLAQNFYNELMIRYIVGYSNFDEGEVYRTGFSKLLHYAEFQDPSLLASSLALFENTHGMRLLLKDCIKHKTLKYWIGDDLIAFSPHSKSSCSVAAVPYCVNKQPIGAVGILGPIRIPYKTIFGMLYEFSESLSEALTKSLYKYKINMREVTPKEIDCIQKKQQLIGQSSRLLLENQCP